MAAIVAAMATGCDGRELRPADPATGKYATQQRTTALEHSVYMGKQVSAFAGHILGRVIALEGMRLAANPQEVTAARSALSEMEDIRAAVESTYPGIGRDDDRQGALTAMGEAVTHVREYIRDLEVGKDVSRFTAVFQADYNAVTAYGGVYVQ